MRPSELMFRVGSKMPAVSRLGLWCLANLSSKLGLKPHWAFSQLANSLDYRVPVSARLGNGMNIHVFWDDVIGNAIRSAGFYEPFTVHLLTRLLRQGDIFLDLGANVGQYTLVAAPLVSQNGAVHAFEPDPRTYAQLSYNVRANSLANVRLNKVAVSSSTGIACLHLPTTDNLGAASLRTPRTFSGRTVQTSCVTLDSYCARNQIEAINVMKIDVEGAELDVLRGGETVLGGRLKPAILIEFAESLQRAFGSSCSQLQQWLETRGYHLFRVGESFLRPYDPKDAEESYVNVLALPSGHTFGVSQFS